MAREDGRACRSAKRKELHTRTVPNSHLGPGYEPLWCRLLSYMEQAFCGWLKVQTSGTQPQMLKNSKNPPEKAHTGALLYTSQVT